MSHKMAVCEECGETVRANTTQTLVWEDAGEVLEVCVLCADEATEYDASHELSVDDYLEMSRA